MEEKQKRTKYLKIRVNEDERAEVYARVPASSDFADWARRILLDLPLRRRASIEKISRQQSEYNPQLADVKNHYAWALSNFNQISKNLNESAKRKQVSPSDVMKAYSELLKIRQHLDEMKGRLPANGS